MDGRYIVCEVKGVSGTAKESFAAQLEKWSSEFYEREKVIPKSLLVVATHRHIPLSERRDPDFPKQMLNYVGIKNQACITTVTLYSMMSKYYEGKLSGEDVFNKFYNITGIIKV